MGRPGKAPQETQRPASGSRAVRPKWYPSRAEGGRKWPEMAARETPSTTRTNGASSAEDYAPIGNIEIEPDGVVIKAKFRHPDIVGYAETGGLGLDQLGN